MFLGKVGKLSRNGRLLNQRSSGKFSSPASSENLASFPEVLRMLHKRAINKTHQTSRSARTTKCALPSPKASSYLSRRRSKSSRTRSSTLLRMCSSRLFRQVSMNAGDGPWCVRRPEKLEKSWNSDRSMRVKSSGKARLSCLFVKLAELF